MKTVVRSAHAAGVVAFVLAIGLNSMNAVAADAPAKERFGDATFITPAGWTHSEVSGWLMLVPPDVPAGQIVCIYLSHGVESPNPLAGDMKAQIDAMQRGMTVVSADPPSEFTDASGIKGLNQVVLLRDANGAQHVRSYWSRKIGNRNEFTMFTSSDPSVTKRVVEAVQKFDDDLAFAPAAVAAAPGAAPAAAEDPMAILRGAKSRPSATPAKNAAEDKGPAPAAAPGEVPPPVKPAAPAPLPGAPAEPPTTAKPAPEEHFGQSFFVPPPGWTKKEANGWLVLTPPNVAQGQVVAVYLSSGVKSPNSLENDFNAEVDALQQGLKVEKAEPAKKTPIDGGWERIEQTAQLIDANGAAHLRNYIAYRHDGWFEFVMFTGSMTGLTPQMVAEYKAFAETVSYDEVAKAPAPATAAPVGPPPPLAPAPGGTPPAPAVTTPPAPIAPRGDARMPDAKVTPSGGPEASAMKHKLQGTWIILDNGFPGKDHDKMNGAPVRVKGDDIFFPDAEEPWIITAVDPSRTPAWIEMNTVSGRDPHLGIYELDGDSLSVCFNSSYDGKSWPRPTAFAADPKGDLLFLKMKRPVDSPATKAVKEKLAGTWKVMGLNGDGRETAPEQLNGMSVVIEGDVMTVKDGRRVRTAVILSADSSPSPAAIDLYLHDPAQGIFRLDGTNLTLSIARSPAKRPTSFDGGERLTVYTLTRQ